MITQMTRIHAMYQVFFYFARCIYCKIAREVEVTAACDVPQQLCPLPVTRHVIYIPVGTPWMCPGRPLMARDGLKSATNVLRRRRSRFFRRIACRLQTIHLDEVSQGLHEVMGDTQVGSLRLVYRVGKNV